MASAVRAIRKKKKAQAEADENDVSSRIAGAPGQAIDLTGDGRADIVIPATSLFSEDVASGTLGNSAAAKAAKKAARQAEKQNHDKEPKGAVEWLPHTAKAVEIYQNKWLQLFVAAVIIGNFFAIVIEKEIDPYPPEHQFYPDTWLTIDDVCNWIFLFELMLNLYGSFWRPFLRSAWNYLDTIVVVVGITSLLRIELGPLKQIKILRAFRVLRLFKRVESLNKILVALLRSIPGVMNAFLVMLIFMMVFAIISVDFFRGFGDGGDYKTTQRYGVDDARWGQGAAMVTYNPEVPVIENTTSITAMTARGFHFGQEYFGTFSRSLYTLFQVLTGESWSEAVVRPLLFGYASNAVLVGTFFTLYILLTQVVLQNVVVAVLLDKFVEEKPPPGGDDDEEEKRPTIGVSDLNKDQRKMLKGITTQVAMHFESAAQADEAVWQEAASLGVSPKKEPQHSEAYPSPLSWPRVGSSPTDDRGAALSAGGTSPGGTSSAEELARLRGDVAMIKMQLHVILSRLPRPANAPPGSPGMMSGMEA